jgi:hypothetical protein
MGRRRGQEASVGGEPSADQLHRHFRTLDLKIALYGPEAKQVSRQLRQDAAKTDDPNEKIRLAREAYLQAFGKPAPEWERQLTTR